jgi:hypothetical protein
MREIEVKILESETRPPSTITVNGQVQMGQLWADMLNRLEEKLQLFNEPIEFYWKDGCLWIEQVKKQK